MSESARRRLMTWLAAIFVGGLAGFLYETFAYPGSVQTAAGPVGIRTGVTIAALSVGLHIYGNRGRLGRWLRRRSFAVAWLVRELMLTVIVVVTLLGNVFLTRYLAGSDPVLYYPLSHLAVDTAFSFAVIGALLFILQMRELIGSRTFLNILIGRYHRPVKEERIFLIFDLEGSTRLAASIGDERFLAFLGSVFSDADEAIVDHGGEIYSYVGDALLATWPLGPADRNARAVEAVFAVLERLRLLAPDYQRRFGAVPKLRGVLHGGPVVAGECGDSKRQITYLGDVLNLASRLEGVAKELGLQVLISSALLSRTQLPKGIAATPCGWHALKGVREPVQAFALTRAGVEETGSGALARAFSRDRQTAGRQRAGAV